MTMPLEQTEFNALREIVRENTGDEMMLLNRFTARGIKHALGVEQEYGLEPLLRNGVIVEKAGHYEFSPEVQRALARQELGDSLRVAEAIAKLRLGKQAFDLATPDMQKGVYRGEILGSSKWHVVQRVGNSLTAVAHLKNQLDAHAVSGAVEITYSRGKGAVSEITERQRRHSHPKELALRR
jgi:hypothetical protein